MATRRDFEAIAKAIKDTKMDGMVRESLICNMHAELRKENGRIIFHKFHDACTPEPEPIVVASQGAPARYRAQEKRYEKGHSQR